MKKKIKQKREEKGRKRKGRRGEGKGREKRVVCVSLSSSFFFFPGSDRIEIERSRDNPALANLIQNSRVQVLACLVPYVDVARARDFSDGVRGLCRSCVSSTGRSVACS